MVASQPEKCHTSHNAKEQSKKLTTFEEIGSWCENIEAMEKMYINNQTLFGQHIDDRSQKLFSSFGVEVNLLMSFWKYSCFIYYNDFIWGISQNEGLYCV